MKTKFLYSLVMLAFGSVLLMSRMNGPAANGAGDRTGSPVANGTCTSCHSGGSFDTDASFMVYDAIGNVPITEYTPGEVYYVAIRFADIPASAAAKYGFQAVALFPDNSNAGTFSASAVDTFVKITPLNNRSYAEHKMPKAVVPGISTNIFYFLWQAPSSSEDVSFYASLNCVNGNSATSGDAPVNLTAYTISAVNTGTALAESAAFSLFPNPAVDYTQISLNEAPMGKYVVRIYDMLGREWLQQSLTSNQENIDLSLLPKGHYSLQVLKDGKIYAHKILLKQ